MIARVVCVGGTAASRGSVVQACKTTMVAKLAAARTTTSLKLTTTD
jgi:hypothetical protein